MRPDIQTVSGRFINFLRPDLCQFSVEDIGHALSNICRFTGHTREFYSVAQHAVHCSYLVPPEHAFAALHHDDAESVMGDMSSPLKHLLPEYKVIEKRVEAAIFPMFGLPVELSHKVKQADLVMLATEKRDLLPRVARGATIVVIDPLTKEAHLVEASADSPWRLLDGVESAGFPIIPLPPRQARDLFMCRHEELQAVRFGMAVRELELAA